MIMSYNLQANEWSIGKLNLEPDLLFKSYCSAVRIDTGVVLLIGGGFSNEICEFNPATMRTFLRANMDRIRTEHASVHTAGKVYILGGFDKKENQFLADCECFDVATNRVSPITPMQVGKCGFSSVCTDKCCNQKDIRYRRF